MDVLLLLGCNGLTDKNGFLYCHSTVNSIVDLSSVPAKKNEKIVAFLEKACDLFDGPCYDYNKCINIINFLYRQFEVINEDTLHKVQSYIRMHRACGIYIMLILKEDYNV